MKNSVRFQILELMQRHSKSFKSLTYKDFLGLPSVVFIKKSPSFSNEVRRLQRDGFWEQESEKMRLTKKGQEYIKRRQDSLSVFIAKVSKSAPKNLLVMFDIPEPKKAEREWFRFHLKKFGFVMIQRSVWVGPSPLPKDFMNYVEKIKLRNCIKTFKLAKSYSSQSLL